MPRPLLFCLKSERSVCYSVPDNSFIGGEEALVLSQRLKSYQQEREEKPKKREKRKYQQEER